MKLTYICKICGKSTFLNYIELQYGKNYLDKFKL